MRNHFFSKLLGLALSCIITSVFAKPGLLFNVNSSGPAIAANITLCLNGTAISSCQNYLISGQNLAISATSHNNYPFAGIKILTPGFTINGCTIHSNGYCIFTLNHGDPNQLTIKKRTLLQDIQLEALYRV